MHTMAKLASSSLRYGPWCGAPSLQCQSSREREPQPNSPLQPPFPPRCTLLLSPAVLLDTTAQKHCFCHHYGKHSFGFQEWDTNCFGLILLEFHNFNHFELHALCVCLFLQVLSHTLNSQHPKVSNSIKHATLIQYISSDLHRDTFMNIWNQFYYVQIWWHQWIKCF